VFFGQANHFRGLILSLYFSTVISSKGLWVSSFNDRLASSKYDMTNIGSHAGLISPEVITCNSGASQWIKGIPAYSVFWATHLAQMICTTSPLPSGHFLPHVFWATQQTAFQKKTAVLSRETKGANSWGSGNTLPYATFCPYSSNFHFLPTSLSDFLLFLV
jgi:hypothetical protein